MINQKRKRVKFLIQVDISKIKVYYQCEAGNSLKFVPVEEDIKNAIKRGVTYLKEKHNCEIIDQAFDMSRTCEIGSIKLAQLQGAPYILVNPANPKVYSVKFTYL